MQTSKQVLTNILNTASQTESAPAEQQYLSTVVVGKMTTQQLNEIQELRKQPTEEIDRMLLVWIQKSLTSLQEIKPIYREFIASDGQFDCELIGYDFSKCNPQELANARQAIEELHRPIDKIEFAKLWTRLELLCPPNKDNLNQKSELKMQAYYDELRKYPADIVKSAMKENYQFFPSMFDLKQAINDYSQVRNLIKKGLGCDAI